MMRAALQPSAAEPGDIVIERIDSEGDVEEGCRTVTRYDSFVFVDDEPAREQTSARLHESVPGAEWSALGLLYAGIRRDTAMAAAASEAMRCAGRTVVDSPPPLPFATGFGNITQRVPGR